MGVAWKRGKFAATLAGKQAQVTMGFDLDQVKGEVRLTQGIQLGPYETTQVSAITSCQAHSKRVHVVAEPLEEGGNEYTVPTYTE